MTAFEYKKIIIYLPFVLLKCTQTAFIIINISKTIDKMMQPIAAAETPWRRSVTATAVDTKIRDGFIDRNNADLFFFIHFLF